MRKRVGRKGRRVGGGGGIRGGEREKKVEGMKGFCVRLGVFLIPLFEGITPDLLLS